MMMNHDAAFKARKVIAFDLDDTLAVTKSPITSQMGNLLERLLDRYDVCVISGGNYEQFKTQVVNRLTASSSPPAHSSEEPSSPPAIRKADASAIPW